MLRLALAFVLVLFGMAAVWGVGIEPRLLEVRREVALLPNLPASWEGRRVAVAADLQIGMWLDNTDTVRRAIDQLLRDPPEVVLLLGDFIYEPEEREEVVEELREVSALLAPLRQLRVPVFAVLGNHDFGQERPDGLAKPQVAASVERALVELEIQVLNNRAQAVSASAGEALFIVGIGPHWPGRDRPLEALAEVPPGAARVVAMHHPDTFAAVPPGQAPLALAGHTHGGQVRLPFLPDWSWMEILKSDVHADGWIEPSYGASGNRLYVNRGIGFSGLPVRINCRPELTYFTLRRAR